MKDLKELLHDLKLLIDKEDDLGFRPEEITEINYKEYRRLQGEVFDSHLPQKDRRLQKVWFAEEIDRASGCSVFKQWDLVIHELRRELEACIKSCNDKK